MISAMSRIRQALPAIARRGRGGRWPLQDWFVDAAIVVAAFGFSSLYAFEGKPISSLPVWAAAALTVALVVPVAVRRVWPVAVFAWCFTVAAAAGWWAMQIVWSPALLVGLYTVAARRGRRVALAAAALLAAACVVAAAHVVAGGWAEPAAALLACVVAALGLGLYSAARHALVAELRERARRLEAERDQQGQLAAAAERARIASEMHDMVAHHLTAIVTLSDGAAAQVRRAPGRAEAAMAEAASTARLALRDTRHLLGVLREERSQAGLIPLPGDISIDQLIERVRSAGLAVRFETAGDPPAASSAVLLCMYRVIQESLTNTMKHAGRGARATIRVHYAPAEICILAEDDGQGTAPLPVPPSGQGLAGMRERVRAVGGAVSSGPRSPRGWVVSARLPVGEAK
jgi:signal transduction histidine kinase